LDLPFSNVVSVAENDQPNNPAAMSRKVNGVYERFWRPRHAKLAAEICGYNKVSVASNHVRHVHGQARADDVARRPFAGLPQ
jgi:hypothetical protein